MGNKNITLSGLYDEIGISPEVRKLGSEVCSSLLERFMEIDKIAEINQLKVLLAMKQCRVNEACFNSSTGYGYSDLGRDTLEKVYAKTFNAEDALVRSQIVCGTHALAVALSGNLRPGDEILLPAGGPYDTLEEVIGIRDSNGSLSEYGITYRQAELTESGSFDYEKIRSLIQAKTKIALIQRSRGYQNRPTFSVEKIGRLIKFIKSIKPDIICVTDNCYGEFVETTEPTDAGSDLIVGSLIKNPGGSIASSGGYICGKKEYVENASYRLTAPGLGREVGASLGQNRSLFQGFFMSPVITASAVKSAVFAANIYEKLGFKVKPAGNEIRHDIIQEITLENAESIEAFCKGIQSASPVDGYVTPEAWDMPGYDSKIIMACGTFVSGSSIELSADAPIRPPYSVYFQGGITWEHAKTGILMSLQKLIDKGVVDKEKLKA